MFLPPITNYSNDDVGIDICKLLPRRTLARLELCCAYFHRLISSDHLGNCHFLRGTFSVALPSDENCGFFTFTQNKRTGGKVHLHIFVEYPLNFEWFQKPYYYYVSYRFSNPVLLMMHHRILFGASISAFIILQIFKL